MIHDGSRSPTGDLFYLLVVAAYASYDRCAMERTMPIEPDAVRNDDMAVTGSFLPVEIGEIPRAPGIYRFHDAKGRVLYVGKALNLRARVRQYFAESGGDDRASVPHIRAAMHHIEVIVTSNEKEAFILENTLIKRHRPRYNVRLRDDKTYASVEIDMNDEWPRPYVVRSRGFKKNVRTFGPYINTKAIRKTVDTLQRVFPLRSCKGTQWKNRKRPCVFFQVGRCLGPCFQEVDRALYDENLRNTMLVLRGKIDEAQRELERRMEDHAERLEFELAARLRDRIAALAQCAEIQNVTGAGMTDRDAIGYAEEHGQVAIVLQNFREGRLIDSRSWVLRIYGETSAETLSHFLGQYYATEGRAIPREILLPEAPEDLATIAEWLSEKRGSSVELAVPQRGEKRRLVENATTNASEALARKLSGLHETQALLEDLAQRLHLSEPPRRIECYDIATLQGDMSAGSRVTLLDGQPHKAGYRLYKIRQVEGIDDFAMMREVLTRRFARILDGEDEKPDLVVLDGGMTDVPLAALAKSRLKELGETDEKQRTPERLFLPNRKNPVVFPPYAPSFYLLQCLRDEAHRFVNTYHRKLRKKAHLTSALETIPGIGKGRVRTLLRHFGSLTRVREASIDDLAGAPGMGRTAAEAVWNFYHPTDESEP
jgi:excinuclease ABC subunit C